MKKLILILFLAALTSTANTWANPWIQKASVGSTGRQSGVGFSVGGMGYIGLGRNVETSTLFIDFWQYDPIFDTWTQLADFGGTARYASSCFVIGDTAYVGLGADNYVGGYNFTKDFWKYDAIGNTWSPIADFAGNARYNAPAFAINSKGYVGTGYDQATPTYEDFWEYDAINDSWTQKTDYPGGACEAGVGFSIGNYGYMGTGWNNAAVNFFYKYDPNTNAWIPIANFPTSLTSGTAFTMDDYGYVGTGSTTYPAINYLNGWWRYDPLLNTWTQIDGMGSMGRYNAVSFAIGSTAYAGTGGINDWSHESNDIWSWGVAIGIDDIKAKNLALQIYPNPASGKIRIETEVNEDLTVRVFNTLSQCVYKKVVGKGGFNKSIILDLDQLSKGSYVVEVSTKDAYNTEKLILN